MQDLDAKCREILKEELKRLLDEHREVLDSLPDRYLEELTLLRTLSTVSLTEALKFDFGDAAGLAFVLQHGGHDFPALQFITRLDKAVGRRLTELIEKL